MAAKFQYLRLEHQAKAVQAVDDVLADVRFIAPGGTQANPTYLPAEAAPVLRANIERVRAAHGISQGPVQVAAGTEGLSLDVLMETGTGKTFTFIETIHRLRQRYGLSKFIVLVPSNAIRLGTIKSLQTTAEFFAKEYHNQKISVTNYSERTVSSFIHAANFGISVMVATYQSFNKDKNTINKRGVEANLFGRARSYMDALAAIRPVVIIDEPHRFEGKKTREYLARFNPLLTIRFGATFKDDEYCNLLYALDGLDAFRQRLVKGITVDTVGTGQSNGQVLRLDEVKGRNAQERVAHVHFQPPSGPAFRLELQVNDNLGEKAGLAALDGHVVEKITANEVEFTNGFSLPLEETVSYGLLAAEVQSQIIGLTITNHFEREELLFKRGIKALSLFFIDAVGKYLPEGGKPAVLRETFERLYKEKLQEVLARPALDPAYRQYLERTAGDISRVHKGYFARSHTEKGEEEAIRLILQEKEQLLSFDTDLRFIFSMWALQEGWDNPNVFTLCRLAPGNSRITKLQQIGRGLRLAVDQTLQRLHPGDPAFDEINDLTVVVPASEGDFVRAIQSEITGRSIRHLGQIIDQDMLRLNGVSDNPFTTVSLMTALAAHGVATVDMTKGQATLTLDKAQYQARRDALFNALSALAPTAPGLTLEGVRNLMTCLDAYYEGAGQIKSKQQRIKPTLTVNATQYEKFKELWRNLNRDAVLHYELESTILVEHVLARIGKDFHVRPLTIGITRTEHVQLVEEVRSTSRDYQVQPHAVYTLGEFARELANDTRLSLRTVTDILRRMPVEKFSQIRHNENRALAALRSLMLDCIHELLVNKVSYELREVRVKTSLTDNTGQLLQMIPAALCGSEMHRIVNNAVADRSLYQDQWMPVDSEIERRTIDESGSADVTVFAKLPRVNIPTPAGHYNPDFGYVITRNGQPKDLYLIVETKGYDDSGEVSAKEANKINSAKVFFKTLKDQLNVPVHYETKINNETLAQIVNKIISQPLESKP